MWLPTAIPYDAELFRQGGDIRREVLGFAARERHVHPRVRRQYCECDQLGRIAILSRDRLERRRISQLLTLVGFDDVAQGTVLLSETLPVIGVCGRRALGAQGGSTQDRSSDEFHQRPPA